MLVYFAYENALQYSKFVYANMWLYHFQNQAAIRASYHKNIVIVKNIAHLNEVNRFYLPLSCSEPVSSQKQQTYIAARFL